MNSLALRQYLCCYFLGILANISGCFPNEINCGSFISFLIWGLSKIPPFFFSLLRPGKAVDMYMKQSLSWSNALTNCIIIPSLMCVGGKRMLFQARKCPLFTLLSQKYRKQGYLVYPPCWLSRKLTIFNSTSNYQWTVSNHLAQKEHLSQEEVPLYLCNTQVGHCRQNTSKLYCWNEGSLLGSK